MAFERGATEMAFIGERHEIVQVADIHIAKLQAARATNYRDRLAQRSLNCH
jgi:hypothetical protein